MTRQLDELKEILLENYNLEYNSHKITDQYQSYHEKALVYFKTDKARKILNNILETSKDYTAVILIDGENIHYNLSRKVKRVSNKVHVVDEEQKNTIEQSLTLYADDINVPIDNILFIIFCQTHNGDFYAELLNHNILVVSDAPSQSEVDDILLFLAFQELSRKREDPYVYVRTDDNMDWLNDTEWSKKLRDHKVLYSDVVPVPAPAHKKQKTGGKAVKKTVKKPVKKREKKPVKKTAKKHVKKREKKPLKKTAKKPVKKREKKPVKKTVKKPVKKSKKVKK